MATRPFSEFSPEEQQQFAQVCGQMGMAPDDFDVTDELNGNALRRISVRRLSTEASSAYQAGGTEWVEEFESDLECGLFGRVTV
ncbi:MULTISPECIES: hypothetical protein [Cupriavidus]|nr:MULTISPECIES: hypothetical protein [Cupriavidus]QYY29203.1 hypothetical protein K2O51_03025 [Cupriavidus pinatubonensis]TPQ40645.1 hypothetical protein C2U69_09265 [Cupriavidus pinatubonensis]